MGIAWGVCRICGKRFETSYDEMTEDTTEADELAELHVWLTHRDRLPKFLTTFRQFQHWNECDQCTETEPCPNFPQERTEQDTV